MKVIWLYGFVVLSAFSLYGCGDPVVAACEEQADKGGSSVQYLGREDFIKSCVEYTKTVNGIK